MNSGAPRLKKAFAILILAVAVAAQAKAKEDFPPFPASEFRPAGFGPREPGLQLDYPTAAVARGVAHGRAVVQVLIDADGQPLDFLVTTQTDPAFGKALLEDLQTKKFQAARLRGVPVPSRASFAFDFDTRGTTTVNTFDVSSLRNPSARNRPAYEAVPESKLDHRLEILGGNVPLLPPGGDLPAGQSIKVFVTFYIDESGRVRAPNVESAPRPELLAPVIAALSTWTFKPATVGGKPTVVFVARPIPVVAAKP